MTLASLMMGMTAERRIARAMKEDTLFFTEAEELELGRIEQHIDALEGGKTGGLGFENPEYWNIESAPASSASPLGEEKGSRLFVGSIISKRNGYNFLLYCNLEAVLMSACIHAMRYVIAVP